MFVVPGDGRSILKLSASDFYSFYRPSKCELRVYLRHIGELESPPGPYDEVILRLGLRHEKAHLATFPSFVDLGSGAREERKHKTLEEIEGGAEVIYQPVLNVSRTLGGVECEITGEPDFLIKAENGYAIRDSKIARRISEKDHPEILHQLDLYGWLFEQELGRPPTELQVHAGTGEIVTIPYGGGSGALSVFQEISVIKQEEKEPLSPVGWAKCAGCGYHYRCWPRAERMRDVALVPGIDQGLAVALHGGGIRKIPDFLAGFNEDQLAQFQRPWGKGMQRVGKKAGMILLSARAMDTGKEILLGAPRVPDHPNYAMFDLEGLPPQLDDLGKIYLWGLQVYGEKPGRYLPATSGFGPEGDRDGWEKFLESARGVFDEYGDLPLVHWHHYERVHLDVYIERYGDPHGIAARVRKNLLDMLPIVQKSLILPLPSYSLKVVENYIGYKRTQEEYGGDWAMAKYIEATETSDEDMRAKVMDQILTYNQEDLEATWAVLRWLKGKSS
jgi:predicted RecB family nuclease